MAPRTSLRLLLLEHGLPGGIETVNIQLVREFVELVECVVWVMPRSRFAYFQQFLPASDRLIYQPQFWRRETWLQNDLKKAARFVLRQKHSPMRSAFETLRYALWDLRLRSIIREHNITHCFCTWMHLNVPRVNVPIGAMVMDVLWKHFPETVCDGALEQIERRFCNWLTKSSVVFPISETTASDIKRFYPWFTGNTHVVPHGALNICHNGAPATAVPDMPLDRCLFYYPARTGLNKDHPTLFEACAKLFAEGHDFEVVLTGARTEHFADPQPNNDMSVEIGRAFLQRQQALFRGRIKTRGYCDRADVETLYKSCTAVVLPSLFEGFSLPLVEALQNGAEIICSDIPAHREQLNRYGCTDEVWLTPAGDAAALAEQMEQVLLASRQPRWRKRSQSNGLEGWTWKDAAAAYIESLAAITP